MIGWSVDVRAPVFMIAPCTIEATGSGVVFNTGKAVSYAVYGLENDAALTRERCNNRI